MYGVSSGHWLLFHHSPMCLSPGQYHTALISIALPSFKIQTCESSNFVLIFEDFLKGILGSSHFQFNLMSCLSICIKSQLGFRQGLHWVCRSVWRYYHLGSHVFCSINMRHHLSYLGLWFPPTTFYNFQCKSFTSAVKPISKHDLLFIKSMFVL